MVAVITAALVLVAGSLGWVARDREAREAVVAERDLAIKSKERAEDAEQRARVAERENKIRSLLGQATALRLGREPGRRTRALAEIRAAVALDPSASLRHELRNEAIACLAVSLDLTPGEEWPGWPADAFSFDFDGKLERYARADRQGNISVRRQADDAEICRIPGNGKETWVGLSPDGKFLRTVSALPWLTQLWTVANPPSLVFETEAPASDFHPDKPLVAVGVKNDAFKVCDLRNGKSREYQVGSRIDALAWHPQANQIAVAQPNGIKIYDLDSEQWTANLEINVVADYRSLAWHPKGRLLAIICEDQSVKLWNVEEGNKAKVHALEKSVGGGIAISINHRGDLLATTAWDGILKLWDPRTGKQLKTLDWGNWEVPRFSPDDRLIAAKVKKDLLQFWEITSAAEFRTFARDGLVGPSVHNGAISAEGRLLAAGMNDGVGLFDLKTAAFLSLLPIGMTGGVAFDNSTSPALVTNGPAGVYRWPLQAEPKSPRLRIGPPQKLALPGTHSQIAISRNGQVVAQASYGGGPGGRLLWPEKDKWAPLAHPDARTIAISPDGRRIATGSHNGVGARIWEADSGKLRHELMPENPSRAVEFSGDGQWLATQYPSCQLWKVGTWEKAREFQCARFGFALDGKMLAVETGAGVVRLLDPASGREFARLENPYQDVADRIFFSPDGARLVTIIGLEAYPFHVWDLRKIRGQLKEFDLDWDLPAYPAEGPAWADGPLQLQFEMGSFGKF